MPIYTESSVECIELSDTACVSGVPYVVDDWSIAFRLGITGKLFWYVINTIDNQYQEFKIPKASGGLRTIHNPSNVMRLVGARLRREFLLPLTRQLGPHVAAYQEHRNTRAAVEVHLRDCPTCQLRETHTCRLEVQTADTYANYRVVRVGREHCSACAPPKKHACPRRGVKIHMDITNFFGSTRQAWIRQYFQQVVGYNHYASSLFARLLTVALTTPKGAVYRGVPQGSNTSGDICNLIANWRIDAEVLRQHPEWTYTRYADDLYFTHEENLPKEDVDKFIKSVEAIVTRAGYRVNRKKLQVQRPGGQQRLLGITLNQKAAVPRTEFRAMRSLLHNCIAHGFASQLTAAQCETEAQMHTWLKGKINYYRQISFDQGEYLYCMYSHAVNR